jgi:hypothetical protein
MWMFSSIFQEKNLKWKWWQQVLFWSQII